MNRKVATVLFLAILAACSSDPDTGEPDADPDVPALSCDHDAHELPVVTHWSRDAGGFAWLASDEVGERREYVDDGSGCYPVWKLGPQDPFFPAYEQYVGQDFALTRIPDDEARAWARQVCADFGQPLKILRPDALGPTGPDPGRVIARAPYIQLIHGVVLRRDGDPVGSLATIVLPAGWDPAAGGTYPIIGQGYYDLNQSTFQLNPGRNVVQAVAASTTDGRRGAIGFIYNGNGAKSGYTFNELAYHHFALLVDEIARLGGDRDRVVLFGGSRGGHTAINLATNPFDHDYTVVYVGAGAAAVRVTRLADVGPSFTHPSSLGNFDEIIGFHDTYAPGWTYPACGRPEFRGRSPGDVASEIVIGTADRGLAEERSAFSAENVALMVAHGTRVYIDMGTNDHLLPAAQLDYALRLLAEGGQAEVHVAVRGGHGGIQESSGRARQALLDLLDGVDPAIEPGMFFHALDRVSGQFVPLDLAAGEHPFVMEAPYVVPIATPTPWVFTGTPGTELLARVIPPDGATVPPIAIAGTIPVDDDTRTWIATLEIPARYPLGTYRYELSIRKPGAPAFVTIDPTSTPAAAGTLATLEVVSPAVLRRSGAELEDQIGEMQPTHPAVTTTAWGLSEY